VGKGVPGFGIERAPSREGVSALDHQATPAACLDSCCGNYFDLENLEEHVEGLEHKSTFRLNVSMKLGRLGLKRCGDSIPEQQTIDSRMHETVHETMH
jgi:hypothetical protein